MSRSYRKTPRSGDQKSKFFKNYANRILRRQLNRSDNLLPQGKSFKKYFDSYDIADFEEVGTTFERYYQLCVRSWYSWKWHYEPFPDREKSFEEYQKWFKRK